LAKNHAVALFMYASGIIKMDSSERLSAKYVGEMTGIQMEMINEVYRGKFKINGECHPITQNLDKGEIYGDFKRKMWANASSFMGRVSSAEVQLYPLVCADDPDAQVLAYFLDSEKPALAVKEMPDYTAVYCGSKYLGCEVIKEIARFAGCHIYSDTDDVLYANAHYVTIHAAQSGHKTIRLPQSCDVVEVYENKRYGSNVSNIELDMLKGETKMFQLIFGV
jgi:hypothetical protein